MTNEIHVKCPNCSNEFYVAGAIPYSTRCDNCDSEFAIVTNMADVGIDNLDAVALVKEVRNMSRLDVMLLEIKAIENLIAHMDSENERDVEETLYWIRYCADIGLGKEA